MYEYVFPVITEKERKLPVYLDGVGCWHEQEHVIRKEGAPRFQWMLCHVGEGELIVEGQTCSIKQGQGILLHPHVPHEYYKTSKDWKVDWITFNGNNLQLFFKTIGMDKSGVFYVSDESQILSRIRNILKVAQSDNDLRWIDCSSIIYSLLMDLLKFASQRSDESMQQKYLRIKPVFKFIDERFGEDITLKNLADLVEVTPQHFCILFKEATRTRPVDYINRVRIKKSKEIMIKNNNLEIKEIAKMVGFKNSSYFGAAFKVVEGSTPGSFMKLQGI